MSRLIRGPGLLVVVSLFAAAGFASEPLIVRGEVAILVEQEAVTVRVDADRDGHTDHTFRLQTSGTVDLDEQLIADAQVTFVPERVYVVSIDTPDSLTLSLSGAEPGAEQHARWIEGSGLSHLHHATPAMIEAASRNRVQANVINDPGPGGGSSGSSCLAGGPGTVSCSRECPGFSCAVTCASGYYACCSCLYCKCFKNS